MTAIRAQRPIARSQGMRDFRLGMLLLRDRIRRQLEVPVGIGILALIAIAIVRTGELNKPFLLAYALYALCAFPASLVRTSLWHEGPLRALEFVPIPQRAREFAEWIWWVHVGPFTFLVVTLLWTAGEFANSGQWSIPNLDVSLVLWIVYVVSGAVAVLNEMVYYEARNPATRRRKTLLMSVFCVGVLGGLAYQPAFLWRDVLMHHWAALVSGTGLLVLSWIFHRYMVSEAGMGWSADATTPETTTTSQKVRVVFFAVFTLAYLVESRWGKLSHGTAASSEQFASEEWEFFSRLFAFISVAVVSRKAAKWLLPMRAYRMLPVWTSRVVFRRFLIQFMVCAAHLVILLPIVGITHTRDVVHFGAFLAYAAIFCLFVESIRLWDHFTLDDRIGGVLLLYPMTLLASMVLAGVASLSLWSLPVTFAVLGVLAVFVAWFYLYVYTHSMIDTDDTRD